jgi:methionine--tRNA ligase beta chain
MNIKFLSLGSGSSGNCYYLGTDTYGILIDAGIGIRTIKKVFKEYNLPFDSILAIFITHDHADHVRSVGNLSEQFNIPVYATEKVHSGMERCYCMTKKVAAVNKRFIKKEEPVIDIEAKEEITFEEFGKMQFQVGEIIACEAVKKSKKLLCSQVKIGSEVKQIVSGIKAHYTQEEMVGKKVMVLVNLKPAKLAGVLSEGMILCAEGLDGELSLMVPEKAHMPAGSEIA